MRVEYKFVRRPPRDNPLNAQALRFATRTKKKCLYVCFPYRFLQLIGLKSVFHKKKKNCITINNENSWRRANGSLYFFFKSFHSSLYKGFYTYAYNNVQWYISIYVGFTNKLGDENQDIFCIRNESFEINIKETIIYVPRIEITWK